ncbi:hypothetical protein LIT38_13970 [Bacillus sp. CMF12]|uniref:hypothetical protein n=1 Tax=Bacillaceae TaxID=186817 RepID=UPI001FB28CBB|nr:MULTISPECIES: hypothetical protein [Bacillaceae]UOE53268.1 hypothetical protein IRB79_15250 [Cytobacillus oceanisediminis]USK47722.1 hypothetical protein LIT38_13970 [Bacillus sp. CMF12]
MSCGRRRFDDVAGAFDRDDRRRRDIDVDNVFIRANRVIVVEDDRRDRRRSDDDRRRRNRCPW